MINKSREIYTRDFERLIALKARTEAIARHLTDFLKGTDRFAKTIVFDGRKRQQGLTIADAVQSFRGQCAGRNLIHDPIPGSDADELSLFRWCYECRCDDSILQFFLTIC